VRNTSEATPVAATTSTEISPGVPGADVDQQHVDGVGAVTAVVGGIGQQFGDRGGAAGGHREHRQGDGGADRQRQQHLGQPVPPGAGIVGLGGQGPQHQHEDHQGQRLHQELGQRQIGRAVEGEDAPQP
jgi:hypothetical protein